MTGRENTKAAGIFGLLLAAALLAHFNSLQNHFTRDDFLVVHDNTFVQSAKNLPKLFDRDAYLSVRGDLGDAGEREIGSGEISYRPAATLSYFILYGLFGKAPLGYHAAGLFLHALAAFLAYLVLLRLFQDRRLALFAALLFAVHPVHVEAVNSVSYNEDVLAFLFMMGALLLYFARRPAWSAGAFLLACFSKEMALSFPALLVLCDAFGKEKKISREHYIFYGAALIFYMWIRFFVMSAPEAGIGYAMGTLATLPKSLANYVLWLVWPFGIRPVMPDDPSFIASSWMQPAVLISTALCALLLGAAFRWRKKYPVVSFGVFWFFIALVPVADLSRNTVAAHYLYIPSFGFFAVAGAIFTFKKPIAALCYGVIFLVCCFVSLLTHFTWRSDFSLFEKILLHQPDNAVAHSAMASIYSKWGDDGAAAAEYRVALAFDPDWPEDWEALGRATIRRGFKKQGQAFVEKAEKLVDDKRII